MPASDAVPLSHITGQDYTPLIVGGVTYKRTALTLEQLGKVEAWVKSQFPDPIDIGKKLAEGLPLELAKDVIARAQEQACNPRWCLGTEGANQLLQSTPGMTELLSYQLAKYHPDLTREAIAEIVQKMLDEADDDAERVADENQRIALAHDADGSEGFDPKAEAPASPAP